ncbi:testis-specific serine/threonine kinase 22c [Anopheles darlingi]|uniref:Testis-specific serine/threonine kinase 22c n=1 Tax=Anopheles darlingi TaxID=43151 RepID=W5JBN6_ANODA|nr:testis-specific serine/threonine kinase 22c [Anopheles darlingi]
MSGKVPNSSSTPQIASGMKTAGQPAWTASWNRARVKNILHLKGYILDHCIGEGSYSKVYKAYYRPSRRDDGLVQLLACKLIDRRRTSKDYERLMPRETVTLLALNHPHIVSVLSIQEYGPYVCVFMDYCRHGDLLQFIQQRKRLSERRSRLFFRQLIQAVEYMHGAGYCHRDIKCENILLVDPTYIKLTDFTFAKQCSSTSNGSSGQQAKGDGTSSSSSTGVLTGELSSTFCGSIAYTAPEVLQGIPYDPKAHDMWSLGCVLFILVTGMMPFDESNVAETISRQQRKLYTYPADWKPNPSIIELIDRLMEPDVTLRATVGEVANHPWLLG